jgi:high-affinity nickel-transport protein
MTPLSVLALGLFLGVRHATDADHVVAVSTIVSREASSRSAMWVGAVWGMGHTLTILLIGGAIILLGLVIPPRVGLAMELGVAIMLMVLGVMNFMGALRRLDHVVLDAPAVSTPPVSPHRRLRSFVVGIVHGIAGSAAVALLVLSTIQHAGWALLYLAIFGLGTLVGMMLLTTAMALPLAAAARRFGSLERVLPRITGLASIAFGVFLAYQIGFVDGLFGADPTFTPR